MNVVLFLVSTLLGLLLTPALGNSASPLAKSYRLQRLAIRRSSSSGAESENKAQQEEDPYYNYYLHENPGDAAHLYQATTNIVDNKDTTNRRQDDNDDDKALCTGMTLDLSLHIVNRFHATLCLTPNDDTNNMNNNNNQGTPSMYHVKLVGGRMSSTRMYAVDDNVRALETQWNAALPQVTLATLQAETLTLRGDNPDKVEIRFQAIQNNDQSITDQGSA